uniref:Ubiquitin-like protease family profile domain-containing protein n=1 Tax=Ditylenchus dipsaci TaxID=166011 RepID=A0A915CPC5_9BILA
MRSSVLLGNEESGAGNLLSAAMNRFSAATLVNFTASVCCNREEEVQTPLIGLLLNPLLTSSKNYAQKWTLLHPPLV